MKWEPTTSGSGRFAADGFAADQAIRRDAFVGADGETGQSPNRHRETTGEDLPS